MIKVDKGNVIPLRLLGVGNAQRIIDEQFYDDNTAACIAGTESISIQNNIYGNKKVKRIIKAKQYNKCCFCEKDQEDEHGHVEHYRPKEGYKTAKGGNLIKPGYYWLGYVWNNLYFVCFACNSVEYKGNLFPLSDEGFRANSHHDNINNEDALILDPGGSKNPRDHIFFQRNLPAWKSDEGENTIKICGIDRDALNSKREKLISDIEARLAVLETSAIHSVQKVNSAKVFLKNCVRKDAEFSAAAFDFLHDYSDFLNNFNVTLDPSLTSLQP